jgi:hypothetical protein
LTSLFVSVIGHSITPECQSIRLSYRVTDDAERLEYEADGRRMLVNLHAICVFGRIWNGRQDQLQGMKNEENEEGKN